VMLRKVVSKTLPSCLVVSLVFIMFVHCRAMAFRRKVLL
jgi:hypothetical protein